jgi:hypothetical protein
MLQRYCRSRCCPITDQCVYYRYVDRRAWVLSFHHGTVDCGNNGPDHFFAWLCLYSLSLVVPVAVAPGTRPVRLVRTLLLLFPPHRHFVRHSLTHNADSSFDTAAARESFCLFGIPSSLFVVFVVCQKRQSVSDSLVWIKPVIGLQNIRIQHRLDTFDSLRGLYRMGPKEACWVL